MSYPPRFLLSLFYQSLNMFGYIRDMKTIMLDLLNDKAYNLLKELEKLNIVRIRKSSKKLDTISANKKVTFDALSLDTKTFKFDRTAANER